MKLFKKDKDSIDGYGPIAAIIVSVGIFFVSQLLGGILISLYPLIKGYSELQIENWGQNTGVEFLLILLVEAITIALIWLFLKRRHRTFGFIGLKKPQLKSILYAVVGFALYFIAFIALTVIIKIIFPILDLEQQQQIGFESTQTTYSLILVFISLVILPPVTEEILCRGFLFTGLRQKYNFIVSALITSVIFACAHLQFGYGAPLLWVAAIDTFVLSMVLSYLREKTDNLWASIMLHMLKNGLAFLVLFVI